MARYKRLRAHFDLLRFDLRDRGLTTSALKMPLTGDGALGDSKFYASHNRADNLSHAFRNLSLHMAHAFEYSPNRDDQGSIA